VLQGGVYLKGRFERIALLHPIVDRGPVTFARSVYRFCQHEFCEAADLLADCAREGQKRPDERERECRELLTAISTYGSRKAAQDVWAAIRANALRKGDPTVKVGHFIAEIELVADRGFEIEDLDEPDRHLYVWGAPNMLLAAVTSVFPAERS
jgi:hypothetical protein